MDSKVRTIIVATSVTGLTEFCSCYINFRTIKWSSKRKPTPGRVLTSELQMEHNWSMQWCVARYQVGRHKAVISVFGFSYITGA